MSTVSNSFGATGQSATFTPGVNARDTQGGSFIIALSGVGVAGIQLECSADNGVTWCQIAAAGTQLYVWSYTGTNLMESTQSAIPGLIYRLNCTSYTSGTVGYLLWDGK